MPRTEKSAIFHWDVSKAFQDKVRRPGVGVLGSANHWAGSSRGVCKFGRTKIEYVDADSFLLSPLQLSTYLTAGGTAIAKHSTASSTPSPSNTALLLLDRYLFSGSPLRLMSAPHLPSSFFLSGCCHDTKVAYRVRQGLRRGRVRDSPVRGPSAYCYR